MKAYRISREALETIGEGTYAIADEQKILQQYDPLTDGLYKGAHLRIALVKDSGFQISGIPTGIEVMVRTDSGGVLPNGPSWVQCNEIYSIHDTESQLEFLLARACEKVIHHMKGAPGPNANLKV